MQNETELDRLVPVRNILNLLFVLSSHLKIYQQGNQAIRSTVSRLLQQLEAYFVGEDHLDIVVARHGFIYDDCYIDRSNVKLQNFANLIFMHGVAAIKFQKDVSEFEIITFLRLLGCKPSESLEDGGIRAGLEVRRIDNIEVVELSEDDFLLRDQGTTNAAVAGAAAESDLWDNFALNIFHRQHGSNGETVPAELEPADLARETNTFLADQGIEEQQRFMREASNFLTPLQDENNRSYRAEALEKLTSYIDHLSPDLKRLFLKNAFNANLKEDFAEDFCSTLSDDLIMTALQNAAKGKSYVPPLVLNLLDKLARNRELLPVDSPLPQGDRKVEIEQKAMELIRPDEFEKYIPENYRHALMQILRSEKLNVGHDENLARLKATLLEEQLEEHTSQIIVHILGHDAEEHHLGGLFDNLEKMLELYATTGNYAAIIDIGELCGEEDKPSGQALMRILSSPAFIELLLDGARKFGKVKDDSLSRLIKAIGPPIVDPILDRLANENNRSLRYFYIDCLKGLGAVVAERASQRLGDQPWYYLRNLLALMRESGDPARMEMIRPFFRHSHPKVQQEALKAGLFFREALAQRILLEQLDSKDTVTVTAAVSLARLAHDPRIFARLSELLERNELFDYQLELKKGVVAAMVEIDQRQALPVLQRFLAGHNLLHPLRHAQFRKDILKTLEGFKAPLPAGLRQSTTASREMNVARTTASAPAQMRGGKP